MAGRSPPYFGQRAYVEPGAKTGISGSTLTNLFASADILGTKQGAMISPRPSRVSYIPLALLFLVARGWAHDTWLQPERFTAKAGERVTLDMTSAAGFVVPESAIQPSRVRRAFGRLGGESFLVADLELSAKTLRLTAGLPRAGVAVIAVE